MDIDQFFQNIRVLIEIELYSFELEKPPKYVNFILGTLQNG